MGKPFVGVIAGLFARVLGRELASPTEKRFSRMSVKAKRAPSLVRVARLIPHELTRSMRTREGEAA